MILNGNLCGKNVIIRSVVVDDAEFILELRLNPELNKYLNTTSPQLEKQKNWISDQIKKENDYYLMLLSKSGDKVGTGGVYDIKDQIFTCGRWIIKKHTSPVIAVESIILTYNFAFYDLKLQKAEFEVRKDNKKVINFHLSYGAKIYKETDTDVYFEFFKDDFEKMLVKFQNFHTINKL
ncbi:GNAT family N-acetyltransferase [Halpernia frigidisoli]|uniref:Protein N-acetyltransferase, RimJ/RimL family n=1 Tax=Halpernia frigidisoli TaxID=1125876 RepID=A0A1I3FDG8_9FLAO|nr:GNAT family N-acetyltransferase [Halpernia frigidisoli]SFI09237.1 Protein N-acetyltransferase, RimJ/RimL family [Halpernia frigidisoli]